MAKDPVGPLTLKRRDTLAMQAGIAIFNFSQLEANLLLLFAKCLGVPPKLAAGMLAPLKSFSAAFAIIDPAVRHKLAPLGALPGWISLVEYITELSGDRNYIAHTPVVFHCPKGEEERDEVMEPKVGRSATAYLLEDTRKGPLSMEEVSELSRDFDEAAQYVAGLWLVIDTPSLKRFFQPIARRRPPRNERRAASKKEPPPQPFSSLP